MNLGVNSIAGSFVGAQQAAKEREDAKRVDRNKPKATREIHDEFTPTAEAEKTSGDRTLKGNVEEETREDREASPLASPTSRRRRLDVQG